MMKKLLLLLTLLFATFSFGQNIWKQTQLNGKELDPARKNVEVKQLFELDLINLKQSLQNAPDRFLESAGIVVLIPNVDGKMERFNVYESSNFEPALQAQYPDIRSYVGIGLDDQTAYLRFSLAPNGIQSMILRADKQTEFIEPYTMDKTVYAVYNTRVREKGELPFECQTEDTEHITDEMMQNRDARANSQVFKTFRLALSCTGEYAAYHGGTIAGALAAMNATMTRVNGVFEKDLSMRLIIINNNSSVIYLDASTDPYSPSSQMSQWNTQLQNTLTSVIGAANYDIGHLFGASGGGGNAGCIGCICVDATKGSGITSPANNIPQGDTFDIDYVAHELGHQLGANHTFSHAIEGYNVNVEPGGGSTIMAYAGITNYNVQMQSDDYFTYRSIDQIQTNLANKTCAVNTTITNQLPVVSIGDALVTIPKGTPYKLVGSATDPESRPLTYCWEQNNTGTSATIDGNSICFGAKTAGPNFRSILPVSTGTRYFPKLSDVLAGSLYNMWESVSDVSRFMSFTLTVRDVLGNQSVTQTASKNLNVSSSIGPFIVTAPALNQSVAMGATFNVTWNVAGTTGSPVNVANVKILLTTDNGANFTTLIASTANDGSESVTLPAGVSSPNANIIVESIGNVFYASSRKFLLGFTSTTNCNTYSYTGSAIAIPDAGNWATSGLSLPAVSGTISSVKVTTNISHTWISDLTVALLSPSSAGSTQVNVWQNQCTSNDNIQATFSDAGTTVVCAPTTTGTIKPFQVLSAFNGYAQAGTWTFGAIDSYAEDIGSINSWSIEVCNSILTPMGISDISFESFNVYPNPSDGIFNINLQSKNNENATIQLYDMRGRLITQNVLTSTDTQINSSVDYTHVSGGIYVMKISKGNEIGSKQIVIK